MQYSDNNGTFSNLSSTGKSISINDIGLKVTEWERVPTYAKGSNTMLRVVGSGGNGIIDPTFKLMSIQMKQVMGYDLSNITVNVTQNSFSDSGIVGNVSNLNSSVSSLQNNVSNLNDRLISINGSSSTFSDSGIVGNTSALSGRITGLNLTAVRNNTDVDLNYVLTNTIGIGRRTPNVSLDIDGSLRVNQTYIHGTGSGNIFMGSSTTGNPIGKSTANNNVVLGNGAGSSLTTGYYNFFLGTSTGTQCDTCIENVGIGYYSLKENNKANGLVGIGSRTLQNYNSSGAVPNTAISAASLENLRNGSVNTAIGSYSFNSMHFGSNNICIGEYCGRYVGNQSYNVIIGGYAAYQATTAGSNVMIGEGVSYFAPDSDNSVLIGRTVASRNSADNSVIIGYQAATNGTDLYTTTGNVYIGYQVGAYSKENNSLKIDNSNNVYPLIVGDFSNDLIGINGKLGVGNVSEINNTLTVNGNASIFGNINITGKINCQNIDGGTDIDFCSDATGASEFSDAGIIGNVSNLNSSVSALQTNVSNFNARIIALNGSSSTFSDAGLIENISSLNRSMNDLNNSLQVAYDVVVCRNNSGYSLIGCDVVCYDADCSEELQSVSQYDSVFLRNGKYPINDSVLFKKDRYVFTGSGTNTTFILSKSITAFNISGTITTFKDFSMQSTNRNVTAIVYYADEGSIIESRLENVRLYGTGQTGILFLANASYEFTTMSFINVWIGGYNYSINNTVANKLNTYNLVMENGDVGLVTRSGTFSFYSPWIESMNTGFKMLSGARVTVYDPKLTSVGNVYSKTTLLGNTPKINLVGGDSLFTYLWETRQNFTDVIVGNINVSTNLSVQGKDVCLADGTNCPLSSFFDDSGITQNTSALSGRITGLNLTAVRNSTDVVLNNLNVSGLFGASVPCGLITGGSDADYCADATGASSFDDSGIVGNVSNLNASVLTLQTNVSNLNVRLITINASIPSAFSDAGIVGNVTMLQANVSSNNKTLTLLQSNTSNFNARLIALNSSSSSFSDAGIVGNTTALSGRISELNLTAVRNNTDAQLISLNIAQNTTLQRLNVTGDLQLQGVLRHNLSTSTQPGTVLNFTTVSTSTPAGDPVTFVLSSTSVGNIIDGQTARFTGMELDTIRYSNASDTIGGQGNFDYVTGLKINTTHYGTSNDLDEGQNLRYVTGVDTNVQEEGLFIGAWGYGQRYLYGYKATIRGSRNETTIAYGFHNTLNNYVQGYGISNTLNPGGTSTTNFGTQNSITGQRSTTAYGTYNSISGQNNSNLYGTYNSITLSNHFGTAYGVYNTLSAQPNTTSYGIYSTMTGTGTKYAGIFAGGSVGINTTTPTSTFHTVGNYNLSSAAGRSVYANSTCSMIIKSGTTEFAVCD